MSNTTLQARHFGKVVEKMAFGAIVQFGDGQDGLLHATRMRGGSRIARNRRNERLALGDAIEVEVVEERQVGNRRKLTLSETFQDSVVLEQLKPGCSLHAEVARVLDSGLIVTMLTGVGAGVDGYVHVSELAGSEPRQRDRALAGMQAGREMELEVLSVATDEQGDLRVRLSQRAGVMRQKLASTFAPGTTHTGRIQRRTEGGYVVSFGEFSGILADSELGKTNAASIRSGSNTRTKVVGVGDDGVLRLTRRGL